MARAACYPPVRFGSLEATLRNSLDERSLEKEKAKELKPDQKAAYRGGRNGDRTGSGDIGTWFRGV
jgi:hypothetical protein